MGYTDGTGLGKNRDGVAAPISVNAKTDRCGVCSAEEQQALAGKDRQQVVSAVFLMMLAPVLVRLFLLHY